MAKQLKLFDDEPKYNPDIIIAAGELLHGDYAVSKPVRAGFTTSAIIAAHRAGIPILYLAPTNKIIKDTVRKAAEQGEYIRVPANRECRFLQKQIDEFPFLESLPLPLPDCDECPFADTCDLLDIEKEPHPGLIAMTYSKLTALYRSESERAKKILEKISKQKVIILDEAHYLCRPTSITVDAGKHLTIPEGYPTLEKIYNQWDNFNTKHESDIKGLLDQGENFAGKHLAKQLSDGIMVEKDKDEIPVAWRELRELACSGKMGEANIIALRDIVALSHSRTYPMMIYRREDDEGKVIITTGMSDMELTIMNFLRDRASKANHIYVSGTLYEPHPGYFNFLSGKNIKHKIFPDFQKANGTITLIPDKWKLTSVNFGEKLPVIMDTIETIAKWWQQPILIYAQSKYKAGVIKAEVKKRGIPDIKVDYYRSSQSMGVESKYRVCIAVGMAEIPINACDSMADGDTPDELWIDSGSVRLQVVHADTWQAINRVKDPSGKVPSKVYMIGCRLDQIRELSKWGTNREVKFMGYDHLIDSKGTPYRKRLYGVNASTLIDASPIAGELKHGDHSQRRTLDQYISEIHYYNNCVIHSENHANPSILYSRENGVVFGIYNYPQDNNELESTIAGLRSMFMNRDDAHAEQYKVDGGASWRKVIGSMTDEKLREHVQEGSTYGSYQIALDDTVIWSCIDIDSHKGNNPITNEVIDRTKADLRKVIDVLRNYGIPFLVEASGSPGSYHVWVFMSRTKTHNAFRFIRQVKAEAGIKCEVFPKQKALGNDSRYGNLVKIPICINLKTGGRSVFVDPDTLIPIEGVIEHPGIVRLLEVPGLTKNKDALTMPKKVYRMPQGGMELDPCMKGLLADKVPLESFEGHEMRLAIAIKADHMGMTVEDTVCLFADQPDFNYEISLNKVLETQRYGYKPYSCRTLKDKCSGLVEPYCRGCKSGARCSNL